MNAHDNHTSTTDIKPMTKNILRNIFLAIGLLFSGTASMVKAEIITYRVKNNGSLTVKADSVKEQEQYFDSGALVNIPDKRDHKTESLFPDKSIDLGKSHFTWGAEFGSSIDMTAHNMSTFDLDVNFGYKNAYFKIIGVGAGFQRSIDSGNNFLPVYAVIRTSFRKRPSLCFLNLQAGYSFSTLKGSKTHGDLISTLGCGINLTQSRYAKSYIIISACSRFFNKNHRELTGMDMKAITYARLQIGINF